MVEQVHEGLREIFQDQFCVSSEPEVAISDLHWLRVVHFLNFSDDVLRHHRKMPYYFLIHF